MSHALNARLWANIDDKRSGSALVAEMTPLSLDSQAAQASFAGSSEMYWADLEKCTCMDFNINQSMSAPCKHMIRLAMELGLLPSAGIVRDIDAAQYRVALAKLKSMTSEGDLLAAVKIGAFLKELYTKGKSRVADTRGVDDTPLRFFFVLAGNTAAPIKTRKKDALALVKAIEARLGEWLLVTPQALLAAFEGYEQTDAD